VIDTAAKTDTARRPQDSIVAAGAMEQPDTAEALPPAASLSVPGAPGSSYPPVAPADLEALKHEGFLIPVAGVEAKDLTDSFDEMRGGTRRHNAIDIMAARNTPVLSAVSGVVLKLHNSKAGGITVYAADPSRRFVLMYGHLDSYKPGLKEGDILKRGDVIGFVGSTGNANPLAPHLHFQITRNDNLKEWWKGTPLNPFLVYRSK
jgi:murein DD-endopeptidase MepM/ murein hydrolase activator NlpD